MASNSDNQVLASRAKAMERQGQYDGGQWNQQESKQSFGGRPGAENAAGGNFNETARFNRGQILDQRIKKFDKKGKKIDMFDDPLCSFICVALSLPEARELTRLQKVCMVPALAGENPGLTQINMDILMEHLNLNITPLQAKVVASVFGLTYKLMGVKDDSLIEKVRLGGFGL